METVNVDMGEIVSLAAADSDFYARTFFPKTARQESPPFHKDMDRVLENPKNRFCAFEVFRGGAKTTKLRLFTSKRIAYGISHTILFVGKSQDHAIKSVEWLMAAVEYNHKWAKTFNLRKGKKWTSSEIEIYHGTDEYPIRVMALGITGSVRGVNVDDYRPDLIVLDDPCDEENTATSEARHKMEDLVFGALSKSLAPASEAPDATMALAQTVLVKGDLIDSAMTDAQWASVRYSCFDSRGESAWPARWSTEELQEDKQAHINRNQLSLWLREMECELVTKENSAFLLSWLEYWDVLPQGGITYIGIDPTPPPKDGNALKQVNQKLDDAVIMVVRFFQAKVFVCEYYACKSPDPEEFINKIFELGIKWNPMFIGIETVMNQRTLKWLMDREMLKRRKFFTIIPIEDRRKKETRIIQTITRYASNQALVVHREHVELIEQYGVFQAQATRQHDDYLDALTIAMDLINPAMEGVVIEGEYDILDESNIPELEDWRSAP
jgi:hypothetical protein